MTQKHFKFLTDPQWELIFSLMQWEPPLQRGIPRTDLTKDLEFNFIYSNPWL